MKWLLYHSFVIWSVCSAYKILIVFPVPATSHAVLGDGYVRHLLNAGHEITYITPYPWKDVPAKLHQIDVSENILPNMFNITLIFKKEINMNDPVNATRFMNSLTEMTLLNKNVQNLLNDEKQQFDVVIAEWLFSDIYSGFSAVFECPYIWASSMDPHSYILRLIDETVSPAYVPGFMSVNVHPFTFLQRIQELIGHIFSQLFMFNFDNYQSRQYQQWFGPIVTRKGKRLPLLDDVKYNASLVLGNSHPSIGQAVRLPQNYKSVAGYHIDSEKKPLPEDLQQLLDNAENGFIYFSMGSILKSTDLPDEFKKDIVKMFGKVNKKVIWKYEGVLMDVPSNVHLVKWAPQQSILSHPNCILFITHGGLLSITEAIHFGVPLIGIPVYADQFVNIKKAEMKGIAKKVDLSYSIAEELNLTIYEVISNRRYSEKVKELSRIYHDRPVSPGKELVYWVEHVIRTQGAPHLRSPALMMPWYQKTYLDLIMGLFLILIPIMFIIRLALSLLKSDNKRKKIE